MDCIGRFLVKYRMGLDAYNIWIPIVIRIALVPLMLMIVKGVWCVMACSER